MASLPLTDQPAADNSPTKVEHDDSDNLPGSPGRLENRRPAATTRRKNDQPSDNPDAHTPVKSNIRPRRRHVFKGGGSPPSSNMLTRGLAATRRFFFAEDKTLHEEYIPNYRYLPILSGLIVPFAILLEVPSLTSDWYIRTDGHVTVEYQENPPILYAAMATSITFAVVANICLIIRFLERRIYGMTVAAIVCLLIQDIINIAVVTTFGVIHRFDDGFTYSQAFWMTVCSTIASVTTTITLLLDYYRTPNFAKSGSGLTRKQRSLVIIFMVLLADLAVGGLVYCFLLDIAYLDSLYFSVVSSFTIGFGDIAPNTPGSQVFSVFYNTIGILNTGLFIAIARSTIVESFEQSFRRRRHLMRARRRLHQQQTARAKRASHGVQSAIVQAAGIARAGTGITGIDSAVVRPDPSDGKADAEREAAAYENFREEMAKEEKKEFRAKLLVSWGLFTAFWVIGAALFMATEGWSYGTAIYFCFVAFSTIGYGDISPQSGAGRAVFIFWAIGSVAAMTVLVSVIAEAYQSRYSMIVHHDLFDKQIRGRKETASLSRRNTDVEDGNHHHDSPTRDPDDITIDRRIGALECIRQELVALPELIIQDARDFQVHTRFVGNPNPGHGDKLPPGLERVLQEAMDQENMNEATRKKVLHDEAAKKALMMLHLETTVRRLVDRAERMTVLLAERDALEQERGTEDTAEFDELVETDIPVEEEEGEGIRDEEMSNQWTTDDHRLYAPPQDPPSRSVSRSSRRFDEPR